MVAHTHKDIDQRWSTVSQHIMQQDEILSIPCFVRVMYDSFKKESNKPKCIEQICYCYNTKSLKTMCDEHLARFALPENSGDNVHYFLFQRNSSGEAIMQYKHKRYSVAMWPRKHKVGEVYHHKQYGVGKVVVCEALKDEISNQKFWCNTVRFTKPDGSQIDVVFKRNAATTTILFFLPLALNTISQQHSHLHC